MWLIFPFLSLQTKASYKSYIFTLWEVWKYVNHTEIDLLSSTYVLEGEAGSNWLIVVI